MVSGRAYRSSRGLFLVVALSSVGLPGLNGFVGEFTIMLGAFETLPYFVMLAAVGVVLAAWYLLMAFRKMAQGEITNPENDADHLKDLRFGELLMVVPLVILFFVIGLFPEPVLRQNQPVGGGPRRFKHCRRTQRRTNRFEQFDAPPQITFQAETE